MEYFIFGWLVKSIATLYISSVVQRYFDFSTACVCEWVLAISVRILCAMCIDYLWCGRTITDAIFMYYATIQPIAYSIEYEDFPTFIFSSFPLTFLIRFQQTGKSSSWITIDAHSHKNNFKCYSYYKYLLGMDGKCWSAKSCSIYQNLWSVWFLSVQRICFSLCPWNPHSIIIKYWWRIWRIFSYTIYREKLQSMKKETSETRTW